jgi:hypothetical protein
MHSDTMGTLVGSSASGQIERSMMRSEAERIVAIEFHDNRIERDDLIDNIFGTTVSVDDASEILKGLIDYGLISYKMTNGAPAPQPEDLCEHAKMRTCLALEIGAKHLPPEDVTWTWMPSVSDQQSIGSEAGAAAFLNVLGLSAYLIAVRKGLACVINDNGSTLRRPYRRFTRPPNPQEPIPLGYRLERQACHPDLVALSMDCFTASTVEDKQGHSKLDDASIVTAHELDEVPSGTRSMKDGGTTNDGESEALFSSKKASDKLKHANPALIIQTSFPDIADITKGQWSTSNGGVMENGQKELIKVWWTNQKSLTAIKRARYCWSRVEVTGEAKELNLGAAINQALVYMRAHRLCQAWRYSTIGLTASSDQVGVLRADPNGAEQCIIGLSASRDVIEMVRLALGMILASDVSLGHHPWMELDEVEEIDHVFKAARMAEGRPMKMARVTPTTFEHRVVRFITIPARPAPSHPIIGPTARNIKPLDSPPARYFVHQLLEDRGSLVGRCSRLFVVSRQQDYSPEVNSSNLIFEGPYVLKVYYADMASSCVRDQIVEQINKHGICGVLLPNR